MSVSSKSNTSEYSRLSDSYRQLKFSGGSKNRSLGGPGVVKPPNIGEEGAVELYWVRGEIWNLEGLVRLLNALSKWEKNCGIMNGLLYHEICMRSISFTQHTFFLLIESLK